MKAMILAAGRGERLRPLTDVTPKPLLHYRGKPLIEYALQRLQLAAVEEVVINVAHLGRQIIEHCGDGSRWQLRITYSDEGEQALETAGGIAKALPMLGTQPFLVVNADVVCDYDLTRLKRREVDYAHLVMVKNPGHHQQGDFALTEDNLLAAEGRQKYTYSGIGLFHPRLFDGIPAQPLKLRPVLDAAITHQRVSGELHTGCWEDVGTVERLLSAVA